MADGERARRVGRGCADRGQLKAQEVRDEQSRGGTSIDSSSEVIKGPHGGWGGGSGK